MIRKAIYTATLGWLLAPALGMGASTEELEQRVQKLEDEVQLSHEESADVISRIKDAVTISGYADAEYIQSSAEGAKPTFRMHNLSVFLKKNFGDQWRFFSEIEFENTPYVEFDKSSACESDCSGEILVEALNFDYIWRPDASFRVGRFFTPAGIWSVDHYPPFVVTQQAPQHIREIFPGLVDGALMYGTRPVGEAFISYNVYAGNGEGNQGRGDENSSKAMGVSAAASLPFAQHLDVGASLYRDTLNDGTEKNVYGVHAKAKSGPWGVQAEYADGKYKPTGGGDYHSKGYYTQFTYDVNNWTMGYRYDFFDPQSTMTDAGTTINSAFVDYHATKDIVLKLEHHLINPEDSASEDYHKTIASISVNLGN